MPFKRKILRKKKNYPARVSKCKCWAMRKKNEVIWEQSKLGRRFTENTPQTELNFIELDKFYIDRYTDKWK